MKISKNLILKLLDYIEQSEKAIDSEWGQCRDVSSLIIDSQMPDIYWKLLKIVFPKRSKISQYEIKRKQERPHEQEY